MKNKKWRKFKTFLESVFHRRKDRLKTWECYEHIPQRAKDDPIRIAREEAMKTQEQKRIIYQDMMKK